MLLFSQRIFACERRLQFGCQRIVTPLVDCITLDRAPLRISKSGLPRRDGIAHWSLRAASCTKVCVSRKCRLCQNAHRSNLQTTISASREEAEFLAKTM